MRSSFLLVCLLVCVGLSSVLGEDAGSRTKYINVGLVSNWGSTPLHMEASEYFAEESTDSFWRFIKTFVNKFESVKTATPQALYSKSLEAAAELLVADKVHLLELSLGLRTYSPKIEMYRQIPKMESDVITTTHVRLGSAVYTTSAELEKAIGALSAKQESSLLFEHDHIFPTQSEVVAHAILYADFADPSFSAFHNVLSAAASQGKVGYVLRHLVPESDTKIDLQGWGVDLAIKNVEYKAMDDSKVSKDKTSEEASVAFDEEEDIAGFRIGVLKKRKPEFAQQLDDFGTFLMGKDVQVGELNVWDFKDMGLQASQKVVTGSDPLRTLRDISQSFPTLAGPLTRLKLNNTLKNEIQHNQNRISEGENLVLLNGRVIDAENLDAFAFLSVLKEEISKVDTLRKLKLGLSSIVPFVSAPLADKLSLRLKLDTESIVFANNLEKDEIYSRWPRSVNDIMRRVYPGQMRFVARNFFTVVLVADLATDEGLEGVTTLISLVNQNLPARVGLLPIVKKGDAASYELAVIVKYLEAKSGGKAVFRFLTQLGQYTAQSSKPLSSSDLATAYSYVSHAYGLGKFNEVVASETAKQEVDKMIEAAQNLGLESNQLFVNGLACDGNKEILDAISEAMSDQTSFLQQYVQQGRINDGTNIYQFLLNPPDYLSRANTVVQRFNKLVPTSESNPLQIVPIATGGLPAGLNRFLEANKDEVKKFSLFLFVDVKNADSVKTALEAIQFVETSQNSRVLVLPNSVSHPEATLVEEAIIKGGNNVAVVKAVLEAQQKSLINGVALTSDEVQQAITTGSNGKKLQVQEMTPQEQRTNYLDWAKNVAGVAVGETAIIINGRKLVLESVFLSKDFEFLELYQDLKYGRVLDVLLREPQFEGVDSDDLTSSFLSTVVMQAASVLAEDEQKGIKRRIISPDMKVSAQQTTSENPSLHIIAVLNPLSKASQKFTPVLITLRKLFAIKIQIYLNPLLQLSDLPLKRYYHYLFTADMEFDEAGQLVSGNTATLSQLPLTRILTLGMDTPEAWLVQPIVARYDLDNIKLEDLGDEKVLQAVFELEYVLVEGNCYDKSTLQWGYPTPPRGLELVLQHTDPNVPSVDTLVMSNFGYFQLKANPGIWKLKLAEGRGSKLFSIAKETTDNSEFRWVTVSSFLGETVDFKVQRQPGMEQAQLLVTEEESEGAWDALSGLWQSKDENGAPATLHIFSVASGHLYERLTRIMMLSVIKQTKNPVKFWFLKNYLSPKFKEIIPHMAKEYNFTYELVTYKWPSWLRKQTEKQRIIWAYKILFLDVLFPLGVKKMIFVDADQVVRTDMMELYNMDLQGAPLAYTPFCNNKPEMDGFRFWKAGYWKDHLRGRPYHISALYVIDLQQFRRTAAGDQLRSTYDMLSRDPNSLANLDQDLPNYLQHNVKIHSLPQEWLWCETWCPEDTKTTAKTIDLCNNPLTKASKLENAVRILGDEWTSLDNEVKELEQKIQQNKSSQPSSSSSSEAHPHSSHTTHEDVSKEKLAEAYSKYKTEL